MRLEENSFCETGGISENAYLVVYFKLNNASYLMPPASRLRPKKWTRLSAFQLRLF